MKLYVKSSDEDYNNLENIARDKRTRSNTLKGIADICDSGLDLFIAEHPNTSTVTLDELADRYAKDSNEYIGIRLAFNKNTPAEALDKLTRYQTGDEYINCLVAIHPNASPETLSYIFYNANRDISVFKSLALNPHTPVNILEQITDDESMWMIVREDAEKTLKRLGLR